MMQAERRRAVVTGVGPVSAVGCGRERFWNALVAGQSGISQITQFDASRFASRVAAEVQDFRLEDYLEHGRSLSRRLPRPIQFALTSAQLALSDAGWNAGRIDPERIGVCVGTSIGNQNFIFEAHRRWLANDLNIPPELAFQTFNHAAACMISSTFDLRGPTHTVSTGCNAGLDAIGVALRWIQLGEVDAALVIGTDSGLSAEFLSVLEASGSLSTRYNHQPERASRPFDRDRDGNVMGEGA